MVIHYKKFLDYPQLNYPSPADILKGIHHDLGCNEDLVLHESCLDCPFNDGDPSYCGLSHQNRTRLNQALRKLLEKHPELFI